MVKKTAAKKVEKNMVVKMTTVVIKMMCEKTLVTSGKISILAWMRIKETEEKKK